MNYTLLVLGLGAICFAAYLLYDDHKNWPTMKQNHRAKLLKSIFFGIALVAIGVFVIYKGVMGQNFR